MLGNTPNRPRLYCTSSAFAAVLSNGRVVTWGNNLFGGDSGAVQDQLRDVRKIESTLGKQPQVIQAVIFFIPRRWRSTFPKGFLDQGGASDAGAEDNSTFQMGSCFLMELLQVFPSGVIGPSFAKEVRPRHVLWMCFPNRRTTSKR